MATKNTMMVDGHIGIKIPGELGLDILSIIMDERHQSGKCEDSEFTIYENLTHSHEVYERLEPLINVLIKNLSVSTVGRLVRHRVKPKKDQAGSPSTWHLDECHFSILGTLFGTGTEYQKKTLPVATDFLPSGYLFLVNNETAFLHRTPGEDILDNKENFDRIFIGYGLNRV